MGQEVAVGQQQVARCQPGSSWRGQRLLPGGQAATARRPAPPGSRTRPARRPGSAGTVPARRRCPGSRTRPRSPACPASPGTSRRPPPAASRSTNAACCSCPASGPAASSSSRSITCQPSRWRASVIAAGVGCMPSQHPGPERLRPVQARHQLVPHLGVAGLEEQHHRQQVVHHHPRGQRPLALLAYPACSTARSTSSGGEHLRQHPDPDPVRQPVTGYYLLPWPRHAAILHRCKLNLTPLGVAWPLSRYRSVHCGDSTTTEPTGAQFSTIRLRAPTTTWPGRRTAGLAMGRELVRSAWCGGG